ncbi:1-(5-phosphoribosyl)-5-[(5-phosphoribosylamino)methylideneamino] imidazole-4-carboxamide isomerase [Blochmannia endosymbiont of Camponotus sp. C-003]|uniref:1-(5-phosphoribosyl)-5-[(5- phosphoribosylamino)methylideneamino] imidazole-4-carboxamide isomerase n=1 Tax=Blochmannia endosymbiont of Camponotus sp. C-003 TaxID=2945588 RepID=UPI0020246197|nr:1-(5-phosphoribosyl)-5-[(5-phosphoribosylamino)methylideneamino] imidazole-4-carboxamide isomerase [Blochmannia endosymbiont of Camponotus sp. C-003]URJ23363.1 1-(5-phosphoribosyl)-5-[(5-phosphoribosylamino)methylideneamino] imidazole-4-carboxamide isomerase [Blochmannia endosymbiont of Camponotus sp. C-003]
MIIPALDIINGNIVRLYQGSYRMQTNYGEPISLLKKYIQQGSKMIHLVDLDGAKNPLNRQSLLISQLIKETTPLSKIQIGGGIRNATDVEILLESGATRIVLGSVAVTQPKTVKKWFEYFDPNALVLAIDIHVYSKKNRKVAIYGWQKESNLQLDQIIEEYCTVGLKHIICTDISKDGTLLGSNISLYQSICHCWPQISFQASGGVNKLIEISKLRSAGVAGIIIGRAFLDNIFTIDEATSCWQNE